MSLRLPRMPSRAWCYTGSCWAAGTSRSSCPLRQTSLVQVVSIEHPSVGVGRAASLTASVGRAASLTASVGWAASRASSVGGGCVSRFKVLSGRVGSAQQPTLLVSVYSGNEQLWFGMRSCHRCIDVLGLLSFGRHFTSCWSRDSCNVPLRLCGTHSRRYSFSCIVLEEIECSWLLCETLL